MAEQRDFGEVADQFSEHYDEVRGFVRERVTRHNLDTALRLSTSRRKLLAADVGGGDGRDAEWLAGSGHNVILIEPSGAEIDKVYERHPLSEVPSKSNPPPFDIVTADAAMASRIFPNKFDLVLSHGVLMYQQNPQEHIRQLAGIIKPLGALSILTAGFHGKVMRYRQERDVANLKSLREESGKYVNKLGYEAWAYTPEELSEMLEAGGFKVLDWFGVRIFSDADRRKVDSLHREELDSILQDEIELSHAKDARGAGQLIHLLARKQ